MKTLLLMRHAKSSWKDETITDFERPLNNRGKRDAPFMGKLLHDELIRPDSIVSSPALRAITTARVVAAELNVNPGSIITDDALYNGDIPPMLRLIERIDDAQNTVIIVGHNPGLTLLANTLSDSPIAQIPTCGIACLQFQIDSWQSVGGGQGQLAFFEKPKKHFR